MALTFAQVKQLVNLTPADVLSVYTGKAGKCRCGCAGIYRYSAQHRSLGSLIRGYEEPDEVNDRQVAKVLAIVQENFAVATAGSNYFDVELDGKVFTVYTVEEVR